jgi:hypothetical protein
MDESYFLTVSPAAFAMALHDFYQTGVALILADRGGAPFAKWAPFAPLYVVYYLNDSVNIDVKGIRRPDVILRDLGKSQQQIKPYKVHMETFKQKYVGPQGRPFFIDQPSFETAVRLIQSNKQKYGLN